MNDERAMILKMLQEGKISVEEANALLDVLNEPEEQPGGGFFKADAGSTPPSGSAHRPTDQPGGQKGPSGHGHGVSFDVDLDFSSLKESLRDTMGTVREAMQGVSESLRDAFSGLGEGDFIREFGRAMGRVRLDDERGLSADTGREGSLRITNTWGDVRVTGGDVSAISGTALVTCWGGDEESVREALEATRVDLTQEEGAWVLATQLASEQGTRVDVELTIPRAFSVAVSTASGDLWLEDLAGSQTVNTLSGDINIASLGSGPEDRQQVSTKSGDVVAAALVGDVTLNSLSGDVMVNGFRGTLRATTQSGDIQVAHGEGSVQLKAMSGDINAALIVIGDEPISLTSVSGDVHLEVPAHASLDIVATSTSGDAAVDLELDDAERGEHRVTGRANGGGLRTELSSVSGDVSVSG
ncbi:MAG: DUF4097 family beta strand repeat-containing protein [Spirochaetota bacterium]